MTMATTTNYGFPKPAYNDSGGSKATEFATDMDNADGAIKTALDGKLATNGSAANLTNFPTLNQDTTGSAAKVNGASVPASKTIVGTNSSSQLIDASTSVLSNNILLNGEPSDGTYSGFARTGTAGEDLAAGAVVYLKSDGKYYNAKADSSTTMPAVGIAPAAISNTNTGTIVKWGYVGKSSWTWTVGGALYVSAATAGLMTQTAPNTTGQYVQIVGHASTAQTAVQFKANIMTLQVP